MFTYAEGGGDHGNTKHFRRRIQLLMEYVKAGFAVLTKVPSEFNVADMASKQSVRDLFFRHRDMSFTGPFNHVGY